MGAKPSPLKIRQLCREKGITQGELAERYGVTKAAFSNAITNGRFNVRNLERIAEILGVEVYELFEPAPESSVSLNCPHCGKPIRVTLGKQKTPDAEDRPGEE